MSLKSVKIKELEHLTLYALVPSDKFKDYEGYLSDIPSVRYELVIDFKGNNTHTYNSRDRNKNMQKSTYSRLLSKDRDSSVCVVFSGKGFKNVTETEFPSVFDCAVCEFKCKYGRLNSVVEFGRFLRYECSDCGVVANRFGYPCERCGKKSVHSVASGNAHKHGEYVFELHVLDHDVAVTLGEFLGVRFDNQLGFSGFGSWHNWRNDSSGFDICHVNCLDNLIHERVSSGLSGTDLFMKVYPKEGKMFNGANKVLGYWRDGQLASVNDYFVSKGKGIKTVRDDMSKSEHI